MSISVTDPFAIDLTPRFAIRQPVLPRSISQVHYNVLDDSAAHRLSVLPCQRVVGRDKTFGLNDPHFGVCSRQEVCATCGEKAEDCVGHPGNIDLPLPVFHLGFFSATLRVLRSICKSCARLLLTDEELNKYRKKFICPDNPLDPTQHTALVKTVQLLAAKCRTCPRCGAINGAVRRVKPMRLLHEKYAPGLARRAVGTDSSVDALFESISQAVRLNPDVAGARNYAVDVLDPLKVKQLFARILPEEVLFLGMALGTQPSSLIISTLVVPPVCARPSGPDSNGYGVREDDLTGLYSDILLQCDLLRSDQQALMLSNSEPVRMVENWERLQERVARLLDSAMPGFPATSKGLLVKSYAQRVKGKHGRFRGNLSGKRVNFSGRSVISPDPNLEIDEIAVPIRIAKKMTYPQRVFAQNLSEMKKLVLNGPDKHPGACFVIFKDGTKRNLQFDREGVAAKLTTGDVVERHMLTGDFIIFNRQPSLHRISMMCHRARVLPYRTLRFNECCCTPYNADFDGDEMNLHLVQTEEARAEISTLLITTKNIITARNGEPIIACTQDFLTAAYVISGKDTLFTKDQFVQVVTDGLRHTPFDLPPPSIFKPVAMWTGKQVFDVLIRPTRVEVPREEADAAGGGERRSSNTNILDATLAFESTTKFYTKGTKSNCPAEGYVVFLEGELLCGRLDKKLLGGGAKDGLFAQLVSKTGGEYAGLVMGRIARTMSRWFMNLGFSLGLGDVTPPLVLTQRKADILRQAFEKTQWLITSARDGTMQPAPGLTVAQTLEARMNKVLSEVRDDCGNTAVAVLPSHNVPLVMALSGGKGSTLNIAQMMALVGQQTVNGKRIRDGFIQRSLPHYGRKTVNPTARGFVAESFYDGLHPTEFFFHTMAGREGLIDTAVKTAETGYIYRRLMKAMEDLSVQYDYTVRNSKMDIVQFDFGEDRLDPVLLEGANYRPVAFPSLWLHWLSVMSHHRQGAGGPADDDVIMSLDDAMALSAAEVTAAAGGRGAVSRRAPLAAGAAAPRMSPKFQEELLAFIKSRLLMMKSTEAMIHVHEPKIQGLVNAASSSTCSPLIRTLAAQWQSWKLSLLRCFTPRFLTAFIGDCCRKYVTKICEPATACGAIAAQSVGEPSTQMTLKTFHFAGIASMSITQGVPRLVEIINANKNISTPVVTVPLLDPPSGSKSMTAALLVKGQMERTTLREVTKSVAEVVTPTSAYLEFTLNRQLIDELKLELSASMARERILAFVNRPMCPLRLLTAKHITASDPDTIIVFPYATTQGQTLFNMKNLLLAIPEIPVAGLSTISRVIISTQPDGRRELLAEGADFKSVCALAGVDGLRARCNHVAVIEQALGIEAARNLIVNEIQGIMNSYSLSIDTRHVYLLADVMTHRGAVLGITRYGIQKMNSGVLTMASFERTTDHLYNAALSQRADTHLSVSESVIVGTPVPLGTGSFDLLYGSPPPDIVVGRGASSATAARARSTFKSIAERFFTTNQSYGVGSADC